MQKAVLGVRVLRWDRHVWSSALLLIIPTQKGRIGLKLPYDVIPFPAEIAEKVWRQRLRGDGW